MIYVSANFYNLGRIIIAAVILIVVRYTPYIIPQVSKQVIAFVYLKQLCF